MTLRADDGPEHLLRLAQRASIGHVDTSRPRDVVVDAGALRIHALDWGGAGRPLVFLHGGAMTAHTWDAVCLALRSRYRCVAVDLRGHGDSGWSRDGRYDYDDYAADVRAVLARFDLGRPVLVGQSLGGFVSIVVAASGDPPVAGVVTVDAGPRMGEEGRDRVLGGLRDRMEARTFDDHFRRSMASGRDRDPEIVRVSLQQSLREDAEGHVTWKWDPYQFLDSRREAREARRHTLPPLLPRITCPVLVVRGGRSDLFHEDDAHEFAATLPSGRLVMIPGAGHNVQANEPAALAAAIAQWAGEVLA